MKPQQETIEIDIRAQDASAVYECALGALLAMVFAPCTAHELLLTGGEFGVDATLTTLAHPELECSRALMTEAHGH